MGNKIKRYNGLPRPSDEELKRLLTTLQVKEVAEIYGITKTTVYDWIQQANGRGAGIVTQRRRYKAVRDQYPPQELLKMRENMRLCDMAKELGVTQQLLRTWLLAAEENRTLQDPKDPRPAPPKEEIETLYRQMPTTELAEHYGVPSGTVRRWLQEYGIAPNGKHRGSKKQ